ncbi:MAG TPA: toll/interleukin-1 receptor domain-containing protein, partial [Gemmatimonadota bacterium]|nr:toll/interleukin-1 receptor domain-containing protein [Gemmatimonadota bacterium]
TTLHKRAKRGDILWIATLPRFGQHTAAPSLVAKLKIERRIDQCEDREARGAVPQFIRKMWSPTDRKKNWRYVVLASRRKSRYYPVNDAYDLLRRLKNDDGVPLLPHRLSAKMYGSVGMHLQSIRALSTASGRQLLDFAARVEKRRNVFFSYRRGRKAAMVRDVAAQLTKGRVNCWVDENMMPGRIAKGEVKIKTKELKAAIANAVRQSDLFVAFVTLGYFSRRWTRYEWDVSEQELANTRRAGDRPFAREVVDLETARSKREREADLERILRRLNIRSRSR